MRRAIGLLALPLVGASASIVLYLWFLVQTAADPAVLNVAGRERMLSAELRAWARMVVSGQDADRPGLRERLAKFDRGLRALREGGAAMGTQLPPPPVEVRDELAEVSGLWEEIRPGLQAIANARAGDTRVAGAWVTTDDKLRELEAASDRVIGACEARRTELRRWMFRSLAGLGVFLLLLFVAGYLIARRYILRPALEVDVAARRFLGRYGVSLARVTAGEVLLAPGAAFEAIATEISRLIDLVDGQRRYAESIVASVPVGLVVLREDLVVLHANRPFRELFWAQDGELSGRPLGDLLAARELSEAIDQVLATGQERSGLLLQAGEGPARGRPLRVAIAGVRVAKEKEEEQDARLLLVVEDLGAEERFRAQARATERSFRTLIEQTPDAIAVHRDGRFVYVNPSMARLLGHESQRDLVGEPVAMIVHPEDREAVVERIRSTMASGELAPPLEERFLRKDGSVVVAEVVAMPLEYEGEPAIVAIGRDLTDRKELTGRMMQMDRMIAIGTLAAGVGHEINNPLTYVSANVSFAIERIDDALSVSRALGVELRRRFGERTAGEVLEAAGAAGLGATLGDVEEVLGDARKGSDRIRDIVRDLKTFSRGNDDKREPLQVHRVLASAIDMSFHEIRHRARLVKDYGEVPPVLANEGRLGQVFLNLLVNAAQAIREGAAERNEIRVHTAVRDGEVVVEVRDTGRGIPAADLPKLFDPFFTTKPVGQGTGLGLSICHQIVESMSGRIEVESEGEPGTGSVFRVLLPPAPLQDEPSPERARDDREDGSRRGRILVVDDDPMVGRIMVRTLGEEHEVEAVTSARAALELIEAGARFDLIFCDLMMPDTTGMDFYEELAQCNDMLVRRVIFLTGGAFTARAREFIDRVPNQHIDKPFSVRNLRALVRDLVASGPEVVEQ